MAEAWSETDVKRLRKAMGSVGTPIFFANFKRLLRAKLRFDTFLLIRFDPGGPPVLQGSWILPDKIPKTAMVEYVERFYLFDPFFQYRAFPKTGALYHLSDIAPDRFFSSAYYLQYYLSTGLCDEIGLLAPLPSGSVAHLSVSRHQTTGPYRRREIQCLRHHAPLLLELLSQHMIIRQTQEGQSRAGAQFSPFPEMIRAQTQDMFGVKLTRRETQIAALVLQGHSNGSAALKLGVSRETCKVHRRNLYRKLGISSQRELFGKLKHLL